MSGTLSVKKLLGAVLLLGLLLLCGGCMHLPHSGHAGSAGSSAAGAPMSGMNCGGLDHQAIDNQAKAASGERHSLFPEGQSSTWAWLAGGGMALMMVLVML
ncbi:hypothetical protein C2E25_03305 [Geothermobacter hydrogeniphilus]|uniref:Uncharacterized protein n=1 Tax=Geothermobacter hydrogeniphilus TaxID=1969733 RepID=A0A2K2HDK5_9BACT|nr:hypothetical protein [Geothermobacter hydrogeniphilus]PNU21333.1 hypothetical protein C2E25_03305 [Geothermobacter hydrogeniphilus]